MIKFLVTTENGETQVEASGHPNAEVIIKHTINFLL